MDLNIGPQKKHGHEILPWLVEVVEEVVDVPLVFDTTNLTIGQCYEAGLGFLGLSVPPSVPSWGNMLIEAQSLTILETMPWLWIPPGLMIALAVLSINFAPAFTAERASS